MSTTTIIIGLVIIGFAFYMYRSYSKLKNTPLPDSHERILTLTDANFEEMISDRIILVDFWAAWCAPCRIMAPVLNEMAEELPEHLFIGKIDIEHNQAVAQRYGIRGIPTFIIFRDGKVAKTIVGVKSKMYLMKELQEAGK